jgi:hypothetical protein
MAGTRALAAPTKTVKLTIIVVDQKGKPVADAEVDITHDAFGPEFRANDSHVTTNAQGVVTTEVTIGDKWGEGSLYWPVVDIEAKKDLQRGQGRVKFTGNWYRNPETGEWGLEKGRAGVKFVGPDYRPETCTIVMHPIDSMGMDVLTVEVKVRDKGGALEGASVLISGNSVHERADALTGPDGVATLSVPLLGKQVYRIEVSKSGFESKRDTIKLSKEQLGKIVSGPTITMAKAAGVQVVVTVTDEDTHRPVVDAEVSLVGPQPYFKTTDGSGTATLYVKEVGVYNVTISQANYETSSDKQIHVRFGEDAAPPPFELKAKEKREQDIIEITVLQKNPTDKSAKPSPLPGALVSIGGRGTRTDNDGKATLKGTYSLTEVATVTADGYTTKTEPINVRKEVLTANSYGQHTFILEPDVTARLSLIVEVRDDAEPHELLQNANAYLWLDNKRIAKETAPAGEAAFTFRDSEALPLAKLRAGFKLIAEAPDYELRESMITDLKPSLEAYRATIWLKKVSTAAKESDRIRKAVETLEAKVNAWKGSRPGATQLQQFIDTATSEAQDARALMTEFEAAAKALPELTTFGSDSLCAKVAKLQLGIRSSQSKLNATASQIDKSLKDALARAPRCVSPAEAESLRAVYRQAIKELGEMGKLKSEAVRSQEELSLLIYKAAAAQRTLAQMKDRATQIETLALASKQNQSKAVAYAGRVGPAVRDSSIVQYSLQDELNRLLATVDPATGLPADLAPRVKAMSDTLALPNNLLTPTQTSIVDNAPAEIAELEARANARVAEFDNKVCPVITLDDAIEAMNKSMEDAGLEVGFANDLPTQADACMAKATNRPNGPRPQTNSGDKNDEQISVEINPPKDKQPVVESPEDKAPKSSKPADQTTSAGGFWESAKARARDAENKITNKPAKPTSSNTGGENADTSTNTTKTTKDKKTRPSTTTEENSNDANRTNTTATNKDRNKTTNRASGENSESSTTTATTKTTDKTRKPPVVEDIPDDNSTKVATDSNETATNNSTKRRSNPSGTGALGSPVNRPKVEEIPDDADEAGRIISNINKGAKQPKVEEIPEDAGDAPVASNRPASNRPARGRNNQPPKVEEIPEDEVAATSAGGRTQGGANRPPVVEEIPEETAANRPPSGGNSQPSTDADRAPSQPAKKEKKEKKPRDPNKPDFWSQLGGAIRAAATGQSPPAGGGESGSGTAQFSLSGNWKCEDGAGTFVLTQSGSSLTWEGQSSDGGATWTHTFTGEIAGDEIRGSYQDHPPGVVRQSGKVNFKIISNDQFQRTYSSVGGGGCGVVIRQ